MKLIDFEAHVFTPDYVNRMQRRKKLPRLELVDGPEGKWNRLWLTEEIWSSRAKTMAPLLDIDHLRLPEMDAAGVRIQVLTLAGPGCELFEPAEGTEAARTSNDELAGIIRKHPDRFVGMAALAPQEPEKAADELERCVRDLDFRGVKINSHIQGEYLDEEKYWVILERAEKLDVPIYIHPRLPSPDMLKPYAKYGYGLAGPGLGFAAETQLHAYRLIYSGVFDRYPNLKIILGHMGEGLPFWIFRMDHPWSALSDGKVSLAKKPSDYAKANFLITTSGMFFTPAILCGYMAMGADSIIFASDYPFEKSAHAATFMESVPICDKDKEKICCTNAQRLLKID
ncbi:MAG: amidohydrolase family protein [Desulfobacterales bacterium]|nr:amidohydrolase family protein [Desulfobacterales bacterium]